jgi:type I restriction enzyme, S subunit
VKWRAYPRYKESGIEWLGEIPGHWDAKRLKYCVQFINEKVDGRDTDLPYIGLEHIESWTGKRILTAEPANSEGQSNHIRKGDVLFGKLRPYLAKVLCASEEGICSGELLVLKPKCAVQNYLFYYMLSKDFISVVDSSTYGAKMPRASWEFIGNLPTLVPSQDEQRAIAAFLDRETARIDALIEKKRRQIELLQEKRAALISHAVTKGLDPNIKMKPSGVEWLGEIPEHWEIWKVNHGFKCIGSGTTPRSDDFSFYEGDVPWVTTSELRESIIYDTNSKLTNLALKNFSSLKLYPVGTVLIAMYGATIGRLGILGVPATVNQACCAFSDPIIFDIQFFFYWLMNRRPILISRSVGGGQPNLSQEDLKPLRVPTPPIGEQRAIAAFLENETVKIDGTITKIEESLDKLKEYRTALISAAVTGQIDVREAGT